MKLLTGTFLLCLFNSYLYAQHTNIMISNTGFPEEPSIMINNKDPRFVVAGANIRNAYFSSDTGRTWTIQQLSSSLGGSIHRL
jgi:hypothetical protein